MAKAKLGYPSTGQTIGSGLNSAMDSLTQVLMNAPKNQALQSSAGLDQAKTQEIQSKLSSQGQIADVLTKAMSAMTPEQRNQAMAVAAQTYAQAGGGNPGNIGTLFQSIMATNPNSTPDDMRRGLIAGGHMPNENFSPTAAEGDRVAARNSRLDTNRDVAKIFATPVQTGAGSITTFAANDPRAKQVGQQVQGRDNLSTAQAKVFNTLEPDVQKAVVTKGAGKAGGTGLSKATISNLEKKSIDAQNMIQSLDTTLNYFNQAQRAGAEPLTPTGNFEAWATNQLGKVVPSAVGDATKAKNAFDQQVGQLGQQYRLIVTGQAAADKELERIEKLIPGQGDNPATFPAKINAMKAALFALDARNRAMLDKGIDPMAQRGAFNTYIDANPITSPIGKETASEAI